MGDFNAHNPIWGSRVQNNKGKIVEDILNQEGLCIFSDGSDTYLHPGNGSYSAIDLTLCDIGASMMIYVEVIDSL